MIEQIIIRKREGGKRTCVLYIAQPVIKQLGEESKNKGNKAPSYRRERQKSYTGKTQHSASLWLFDMTDLPPHCCISRKRPRHALTLSLTLTQSLSLHPAFVPIPILFHFPTVPHFQSLHRSQHISLGLSGK
jgi:hypothetical protein